MNDTKQNKLNLGCGEHKKEGYINLDWSPLNEPDVVHDLNSFPYPIADNSMDLVEAFHVLEHLDKPFDIMRELHRVFSKVISWLSNLSPAFASRIWCFWVGGFDEIEFKFTKV